MDNQDKGKGPARPKHAGQAPSPAPKNPFVPKPAHYKPDDVIKLERPAPAKQSHE